MPSDLVLSDGMIVEARSDGSTLTISGWAGAFEAVAADEFRVFVGGRQAHDFELFKNVPTPSLEVTRSALTASASCGYRITVPLTPSEAETVGDSLIRVYPSFRGREGHVMVTASKDSVPTPPEECVEFIGGNFWEGSMHFMGLFMDYADLKPTDDVLDVGCGFGRMALPLTRYLSPAGSYEGFDIHEPVIAWARENISSQYPNFGFRTIPVFNESYNLEGAVKASEMKFPYADESFDFVYLASVFTHMQPQDVRNYLNEIRRCLRVGGRCLLTCFILDEESKRLIEEGKSTFRLTHRMGDCYVVDPDDPVLTVGFEEGTILQAMADAELTIDAVKFGSWSGRIPYVSGQDFIVVHKG